MTVVGTGYRIASQITPESLARIKAADKFFYLVADVVTETWLAGLNPSAENLTDSYAPGKSRTDTYNEIVDRILAPVRTGLHVCVAFYGHPGVFAHSTHEAIRRARKEGVPARMLPGISAQDCLFADLGFDPSDGCQIFEATGFLVQKPKTDPSCALILYQAGAIGVSTFETSALWNRSALQVLSEVLSKKYPPKHRITLYTAPHFPVCDPIILRISIARLPKADVTIATTLFIPPSKEPRWDDRMARRLGMS